MKSAKFDLGQVVATPGALEALEVPGNHPPSSSAATQAVTGVKWMTRTSNPMTML